MEHHGILGVESEHLLDPYLIIPEVGDRRFVAEGLRLDLRHRVRVLLLEQWNAFALSSKASRRVGLTTGAGWAVAPRGGPRD